MRLVLSILLILIAQSAWAATTTDRHILGFSKDGRYFVFEEFAVDDGAGIPKATLYVIDTTNDTWVPGTPVTTDHREGDFPEQPGRDYAEVERELIETVRKEVREKAKDILSKIGPLVPGKQRVKNAVFDFTTDARSARFSVRDYVQTIKNSHSDNIWKLNLEPISFPKREDCFGLVENMEGFRLTLTHEKDGKPLVIAEDKRIPKSRPCPSNNRIEEVISYGVSGEESVLIVLIRYAHPGFEGADGSLLAVSARIKH